MFVPSPSLKTNGDTYVRPDRVLAFDAGDFDSLNDAVNYMNYSLNYASSTVMGYRLRGNMQSGRLGPGRFRPTSYRSVAILVDYSKAHSRVVDRQSNGKFHVRYRDAALGYIGGNSTGWGNPWDHFVYSFGTGHLDAIANRAVVDNLDLRARTEVMLRARNQKFDVSEGIAGIDLTVGMVARKMSQVLSAWKSVKQGNLALAARHLGLNWFGIRSEFRKQFKYHIKNASISEQWLALIYGWLPLLSDISDGVNIVNTGIQSPTSVFTVKRRVTGQLPFSSWMLNGNDDPWTRPRISHDVRATCSYKYRVKVKDQLAAYLVTLGLDNPLYSFWVAAPYSFVIDWLSPVGDWLQALSAPMALQFVDGYRSRHIEGWWIGSAGPFGLFEEDSRIVHYSGPAEVRMELVEFEREQLFDFPIAQPYFRIPWSSPQRLISAVALLNTAKQHKGRV